MIKNRDEYNLEYNKSIIDPEAYWMSYSKSFKWIKKPKHTVSWNFDEPKVEWFNDGLLNITENIFERNAKNKNNTSILWEPNDPNEKKKSFTYDELFKEVCTFANCLKSLGIKKGDRVIIYLPMIPEAAISMLACARIGAVHSVVFAGFSAKSLSDRINDCKAKLVITSDGNYRGNKVIPVKDVVDEALKTTKSINNVITIKRTNTDVIMITDRDIWYHKLKKNVDNYCKAEQMNSEDLLFILS